MIDEKIKAQAREMMGVPKSVINEKVRFRKVHT